MPTMEKSSSAVEWESLLDLGAIKETEWAVEFTFPETLSLRTVSRALKKLKRRRTMKTSKE